MSKKIFMNVDELLKLQRLVKKDDVNYRQDWYSVNGEICFDKQKILDSLTKGITNLKQLKGLTREQVEKAAELTEISLSVDYELNGVSFFDMSNVKDFLTSKYPTLKESEIQRKIDDAME